MRLRRFPLAASLLVVAYLYAFPYFGALRHANELPRVLLTQEIVRRGTLRIDARLGELGSRFDVAVTPDGHSYPNKAPGLSFLAVPACLVLEGAHRLAGGHVSLAEATWAFRFTAVTVPALAFLLAFLALARRFAPEERPRRAALVAYALGSMALPYALVFLSHQTAAACAGGAFVAAVALARGEARRPDLAALAAGGLAGLSVLVDYQSVFAAAAVGLYLVARSPRRLRHAALALAAAVPSAVALLGYHWACFGSPWRMPYAFAADPAHKQGLLGMVGPNASAFWQAFLAPDNGLLVLSPWVVLALAGAAAVAASREARARVGAEALVCGAVALVYGLFIGSLEPEFGRGGWTVGPRYIGVAMPFVAWLAAAGLGAADRHPASRAAAHALVLVGVVVHVVAATTYPHWPTGYPNPLYEVSFRALREGLAPHSLGTLVGLRGLPSLLPLYLLLAGLVAWLLAGPRLDRARLATTALAAVLAAGVVVGYGRFDRASPHVARQKWGFIRGTWEPR